MRRPPTRRSSSTEMTASAGASSVCRTSYRESRVAQPTNGADHVPGLADREFATSARDTVARAWLPRRWRALDLIAGQGGGRVEGYPEDAASVPAGFLYNGALSTYETLGFTRDRKIGKHPLGRHEGHRALVVADGGSPYDMARRARCGLRDSAPSGSATGMIRNVESVGSCLRERRLVGVRLDFGPRRLGWMVEVPPHRVVDPLLRIAHRPPE